MNQKDVIAGIITALLSGVGGTALYNTVSTGTPYLKPERVTLFSVVDGGYGMEIGVSVWASADASVSVTSALLSFPAPDAGSVMSAISAAGTWCANKQDAGCGVVSLNRATAFRCDGCDAGIGLETFMRCDGVGVSCSAPLPAAARTAVAALVQDGLQSWMAIKADGG